jgi:hypothetical protein
MTQAQDFADLSQAYSAGNVALSNRNFIVDGAKESGSLGSQSIASGYSVATMYLTDPGAGSVGTYQKAVANPGPVGRVGWPRAGCNYTNFALTTASTGTLAARTCPHQMVRIEDVNLLESGSWTFSVWLFNNSAGPVTISQLSVAQNFGTGGSPSANAIFLYPVNWVLPVGSWNRYSARLDIPSINGKTMGTNGNQTSWTQIEIDYPVGIVFNINDSFWQLEPCSPLAPAAGWPTAFEYRGQQAEAQRVQRYYETGFGFWQVQNGSASNGAFGGVMPYKATKRVVPTLSLNGAPSYFNCSGLIFNALAGTADALNFNFTANASLNSYLSFNWIADARL